MKINEIKDKKTKKYLSHYVVKIQSNDNIEHECNYKLCNPKNIKMIFPHFNDELCYKNGLNPNIYICKYGKFHDCSDNYCFGIFINNCCTCLITGKSKFYGYSSFETEKQDYCAVSIFKPKIIIQDNWAGSLSKKGVISKKRDNELNYCSDSEKKRKEQLVKSVPKEVLKLSVKKNHVKKNSKLLLKEELQKIKRIKMGWRYLNYNDVREINKLYNLLKKYNEKIDVKLMVILQQLPIKINNVNFKKDKKIKISNKNKMFKYPIFFYSETLYNYIYNKCTIEQFAIQFRILTYWDHLKKNTKNIKKYESFKLIINIIEKMLLKLLPGIQRFNGFNHYRNYYCHLHTKAKRYILHCSINKEMVDAQKVYDILNIDNQLNNETTLDSILNFNETKINDKNICYQLDNWPTWKQWKTLVTYILKCWVLVSMSGGDKKNKRKCKDPCEIVLGALYLLGYEGVMKFGSYRTHTILLPRINCLCEPGYLLLKNDLCKLNKSSTKNHSLGSKIIISAMNYLADKITPSKILQFMNQ
jgi:hypothetical protein